MNKLAPRVRNAFSENEPEQPRKILNSWKEISSYTGRGVRTIQRYEVQFGFPIHRPAGTTRSAVLAFSDEVEAWLRQAPVRSALPERTNVAQTPANRSEEIDGSHDGVICPFCHGSGKSSREVATLRKAAAGSSSDLSGHGKFLDGSRSNRRQSLSN